MPRVGFSEWLALTKVVARGQLLRYRGGEQGYTTQFEQNLEKQIGVKHALTVNSGTSALISALAAAGIGPGDEVLVPAYTWWRPRSPRSWSALSRSSSTSTKA